MKNYSINKKLKSGIGIAVFTIGLIIYISIHQLQKVSNSGLMVNHTHQVLQQIQSLVLISLDNEIGSKGYVISGNEQFLIPIQNSEQKFNTELSKLKVLVSDNSGQSAWIDSMQFYFDKRIAFTRKLILLRKQHKLQEATDSIGTLKGKYYTDKIRFVGNEMASIENKLLMERQQKNKESVDHLNQLLFTILFVAFLLSIIIFVLLQIDIKSQKKLQKQLAYLANMIEQSSEAIFSRGMDQKMISWNKGAEELFGYTEEEVLGKTAKEIGFIRLTDEEINQTEKDTIEKGTWKSERNFYHRNGTAFFGAVTANAIKDENGHIVSFYFIVKDINDRKKLEEELQKSNEVLEQKVIERTAEIKKNEVKFRTLLENGNDVIAMFDASFKIIYRSPSATKLLGRSDQEMLEQFGSKNVHPEDQDKLKTKVDYVFDNPDKPESVSFRVQHNEGNYIYVEGTLINLLATKEVNAIVLNFRDVTEKKLADEKLKESEEYFRMLFNQSPDGIFIYDKSGNYLSVNNAGHRILGYEPGEMIGKNATEILVEEELTRLPAAIGKISTDRTTNEWTFLRKDKSVFTGITSSVVLPNGNILSLVRDITDRKTAEEKLKKSEEHFRMLFDQGPDGIFISDHEGNYQDVNTIGCDMLGYTYDEITKINIADILVKEEVPLIPQAIDNLNNGITTVVWTIKRKDGSTFLGETTGRVLPDGRLQGIVRDVTERIEIQNKLVNSEKQFRNLLDTMLEGAQLIDFDWKYIYVNDAFTRHAKYTREELLGYTVMDKFPGIEATEVYKIYLRCFNQREAIHMINEFLFPDGSTGYFELSFQPVPEGIFILSVDITEKKRAEMALKNMNAELELKVEQRTELLQKANEEMSAFTYSVSHDLRAPLRGIIGFTDILTEDYAKSLDNEARRIAGVIKQNATSMAQLIDDLLAFSRMGKQEMVKIQVDIAILVKEIVENFISQNAINQRIQWNISDLPLMNVDLGTIRQVWINLISNAVKYSHKNPHPEIEIGSYTENGYVFFYIKDNGVGFDEMYKHKLFKVFQRLHNSSDFEGTGVGLALVEKIVSRYGGKVWAEGKVNEGAKFSFSLPL